MSDYNYIVELIKNGNTNQIKCLIERDLLEDPPLNKDSYLFHAIENSSIEIAELLIENEYPCEKALCRVISNGMEDLVIKMLESHDYSRLYEIIILAASSNNLVKIAEYICKKCPDSIDKVVYEYDTPLLVAAFKNHLEIATMLIDSGANINAKSKKNDKTALIYACEYSNVEFVKMLLDKGASVNRCTTDGHTALHYAVLKSEKIVKLILDKDPTITVTEQNLTALDIAIFHNKSKIIEVLISSKIFNDCECGKSLSTAIILGDIAAIDVITKYRHFNICLDLITVAIIGNVAILKTLMKNRQDIDVNFLFKVAVNNNRLEMVKYLLLSGANINNQPNNSYPALHSAAGLGYMEMVKLLLSYGANRYLKHDGKTARETAYKEGYKEIGDYLA